jgi:hypothetical protein
MKHKICGAEFFITPADFLAGNRCPICHDFTVNRSLPEQVENLSNGRYEITGRATSNLWIVHDRRSHKELTLTSSRIIQELKRESISSILPVDEVVYAKKLDISNKERLLTIINKNFLHSDIIHVEDISTDDLNYKNIKAGFRELEKDGVLKRIYIGTYIFSDNEVSNYDFIIDRYIKRKNRYIGFLFGKSFANCLGLCEKPKRLYIVSKIESQLHGRSKKIFDINFRVKGCPTEINNENYKILSVLDFMTTFWKYTDFSYENVYKKIAVYIVSNNLRKEDFNKYVGFYAKQCANSMEYVWEVVSKNEKNF